jgi:hypothetical protein
LVRQEIRKELGLGGLAQIALPAIEVHMSTGIRAKTT